MTDPLVVVVTPVYNGGAFLREAMNSVQAQTYSNLIHLVINNASTDETASILADYENAAVKVVVVHHEDLLPQIPNWNSAFEYLPEGTNWIRWLCADDTMLPACIEKSVACGEQSKKIGFVNAIRDINGEIDAPLWDKDETLIEGKEALARFFMNRGKICAPHMMVRREVLDPERPFFDDKGAYGFDTDAVLGILENWDFGRVHEHLYHTRQHDDTVTAKESAPRKLHLADWRVFMARHAEAAFGVEHGRAMNRRYRRHYIRLLSKLRWRSGSAQAWPVHKKILERTGLVPSVFDYLDAFFDGVLIKLGLREKWLPYPW